MFCSAFIVNAQELKVSESFTWLDNEVIEDDIKFKISESAEIDDLTGFPVKVSMFPLPAYLDLDSIRITHQVKSSTVVEPEIYNQIGLHFENVNLIRKRIVCIQRQYYLQLEIIPIIYDDEQNAFAKINELEIQINIPEIKIAKQLKSKSSTISSSVLSSGKWVKIKVVESGVHKIPYTQLSSWGFSDPSKVNVFGNGGNLLPRANSAFRHEDLTENAVIHDGNAIYFYAQGPTGWTYNEQRKMFVHRLHDYTDVTYYFLSDDNGEGKRIQPSEETSESFTNETDEYDSYQFHELENQNILSSGIEWYGLGFDPGQTRSYSFIFNNRVKSSEVKVLSNVIGRSNPSSTFQLSHGGNLLKEVGIPSIDYSNNVGAFANEGNILSLFMTDSDVIDLDLTFNSLSGSASGWLNYICINAKESIEFDDQLTFRNMDVTGPEQSTRFYLNGTNTSTILWDVTDHTQPLEVDINAYNGKKGFTYKTEELKEFVAFNKDGNLPQPIFEETVENQNIHGIDVPDMLIVAHPLFEGEAKRLAMIHMNNSGLQCEVVFPYQIYNEFSSGSPDISAIRDYARYLYNSNDRFKYLLLFGDGSFDNRTYNDDNTNFILTYQSDNSINIKDSYVSDDFFGFLDDNEGSNMLYDKLDIGIGRFPVSDIDQAKAMVDKIERYLNGSAVGPWKTELTFLADDGDGNLHMRQADQLSDQVYSDFPSFNHNKIYLDAYPKTTTSSGDRYPDVNKAIIEKVEGGTLLFNYTGHGGERQLAHENVLDKTAIKQFTNLDRLPVFVTATCEFSRYDNYHETSAGEWVVLSPLGGGVSMFTTTRIAWSNENFQINKSFYRNIFREDQNGEKIRLGEVIRDTKNEIGGSVNKLNFTLLGDPALRLAYPTGDIITQSINGIPVVEEIDTLKALSLAEVKGALNPSVSNSSVVTMQVFDKPITVKTLGNKGAVPFEYQVYQNRIFKGQLDAEGSDFQASFMVPKDIRYNVAEGRISYYSHDEGGYEAFGADNTILIGDVIGHQPDDTTGPDIELWLNDLKSASGQYTGSQPVLTANLSDESGINTSGVGIGHDITLVIDNMRSLPINLNAYYTADKNSYTSGKVVYQLPTLDEGKHSIELKVWDNMNNSSVKTIDFEVKLDGNLMVSNATVTPNPVEPGGTVQIYFEHDAPNQILDVTYSVYSTSGRLIEKYETKQASVGNKINPIEWTPGALPKGIYIVYCEISSAENQIGSFSKKILIIK